MRHFGDITCRKIEADTERKHKVTQVVAANKKPAFLMTLQTLLPDLRWLEFHAYPFFPANGGLYLYSQALSSQALVVPTLPLWATIARCSH